MSKITEKSIQSEFDRQSKDIHWWNRPVIGEGSVIEELLRKFTKQEISENALILHNREMMDVRAFARTAAIIDNLKFSSPEFLIFIKIRYLLTKGLEEYEGLNKSIELLQVAIEAKDSFISLDQTELRYRGSKQQEFYNYVESLLATQEETPNKAAFREQVQEKLSELLPQVKTDEGKAALQSYYQHLEHLSENQLGLKLLSLFKTYELADYSILRTISEMISSLGKQDLQDLKGLVAMVHVNYEIFAKLRRIVGVSEKKSNPDTYARMIHYIALSHRHQSSSFKFDELIQVLKKWYRPYRAIQGIRQGHPANEYKLPKDFKEEIPGVDIFLKYKKWLTDKKTGMTFVDFDEEVSAATTT